ATIAAAIAFSFPFLAGLGGTVEGYRSVLLMAAAHGLSLSELKGNLLFSLILLSPLAIVFYFHRPIPEKSDSWFIGGLFVSLAVVTIIASKHLAGTHHLLPFVPISVYGLLSLVASPSRESELNARGLAIMVLVPLLVFYTPGAMRWTKDFTASFSNLQ